MQKIKNFNIEYICVPLTPRLHLCNVNAMNEWFS